MPNVRFFATVFAAVCATLICGCQSRWIVEDFSTPESALYDASTDEYIVSNINGSPFGTDGSGYLSRVSPNGEVLDEKWVDGTKAGVDLNAPKGMALVGDVLWVADVHFLRRFDIKSGKALDSIEIPAASFLNDLAAGANGAVYVSDTGLAAGFEASGSDAIYEVRSDGRVRTVVKSTDLGQPNGLYFRNNSLLMVNWAKGELVEVSLSGDFKVLATLPKNQLDGIEALPDGKLVISSWAGGCLYRVQADGSAAEEFVSSLDAPADLGFDPKRGRILVPWFQKNTMTAH